MMRIPTSRESVRSLFEYMTVLFDGENHPKVDLVYQFFFTDIDEGFPIYIHFHDGQADFHEGQHASPAVTVRTASDTWLDIAGGFRNAVWAAVTGKIAVRGSLSRFALLPRLLTRTVETPRPSLADSSWTRPGRALVLVGNPRRRNGLTSFYLEPFLDGMRSAGTVVEEVYLYDKKINPCFGCFACWTRTPGICVQKDDQQDLLEIIDAAELVVYAMPLYFHSMPGLVKDHFDRQLPKAYPFFEKAHGLTRHPLRSPSRRSMVLFSLCGFPEVEQFEPLVRTIEAHARHDGMNLRAAVLLPSAMQFYHDPTRRSVLLRKLELLRSAGEQVVLRGRVRKATLSSLARIPRQKEWIARSNMYWQRQIEEARPAPQTHERH